MCGLVGAMVANNRWNLSKGELDNFTNLLYCSALRGWHSTGLMWWDGQRFHMHKAAMHPADFIFTDEYRKIVSQTNIKAIFGHTRLATSGKVNAKNAHPFRYRNRVILMHNGNVQRVIGNDTKEFDVDSMALADAVSHKDPVEVFETFEGAVACIWFDNSNTTVNFFRNSQRPFWMTESKVTNYCASEQGMLEWIIGRTSGINNVFHRPKTVELPPMTLVSVKLENIEEESKVTKVERKYHSFYGGGTHDYGHGSDYKRYWPGSGNHPDSPVDWDDSDIIGYMPTSRSPEYQGPVRQQQQQHPLRVVGRTNKKDNKDNGTLLAPSVNAEKNPYIHVRKDGPFEVGKRLNFLVYETESYESVGASEKKYKLIATPIFGTDQKEFDNEKYSCVECRAFGYPRDQATKYEGNFVTAKIANIRFNTEYTNASDRLTVFLHDVKLFEASKGAANGN